MVAVARRPWFCGHAICRRAYTFSIREYTFIISNLRSVYVLKNVIPSNIRAKRQIYVHPEEEGEHGRGGQAPVVLRPRHLSKGVYVIKNVGTSNISAKRSIYVPDNEKIHPTLNMVAVARRPWFCGHAICGRQYTLSIRNIRSA